MKIMMEWMHEQRTLSFSGSFAFVVVVVVVVNKFRIWLYLILYESTTQWHSVHISCLSIGFINRFIIMKLIRKVKRCHINSTNDTNPLLLLTKIFRLQTNRKRLSNAIDTDWYLSMSVVCYCRRWRQRNWFAFQLWKVRLISFVRNEIRAEQSRERKQISQMGLSAEHGAQR